MVFNASSIVKDLSQHRCHLYSIQTNNETDTSTESRNRHQAGVYILTRAGRSDFVAKRVTHTLQRAGVGQRGNLLSYSLGIQ
jgi:hypothetical protein